MKQIKIVALTFIIVFAAILRFYKLDQVPPSLNWDEVAAGYNAYTIWHWGADEYGHKFPITFRSFGDDKHPVHIYLTAPFVGVFGLNDFATRSSSALIGVLSVVMVYFLARRFFKSETAGIFAALFLAVSPFHLQFSRGLWETNFALFFFLLGLVLFYRWVEKKNWALPTAFGAFGLSFFSYHSAKVVVPPVVLLLCIIHFKQIIKDKKLLVVSMLVGLVFVGLIIRDPRILGFARVNQTKFSQEIYKKYGGEAKTYLHNYSQYFSYSYLFSNGDQSTRASVKIFGEFYKLDMILIVLGFLAIVIKKRWEALGVVLLWLLLSPIPGVLSTIEPSATRGFFMVGSVVLISGAGASYIVSVFKQKWVSAVVASIIILVLGYEAYGYLHFYYTGYSKADAIEWQYGMKQVVAYVQRNPEYEKVYIDKIRQQPYIYFLYYLKTPLPELLKTVKYDESEAKSYNTVASFDKYQFGGWDIIESYPKYRVLYVVTPSYYGGLKYIGEFNVNQLIKYPDRSDAFYIVSGNREW